MNVKSILTRKLNKIQLEIYKLDVLICTEIKSHFEILNELLFCKV